MSATSKSPEGRGFSPGRRLSPGLFLVFSVASAISVFSVAASAQELRLSNGRIETHAASAFAKEFHALAAKLTEATWVGYAAPVIDGEHTMCDWSDNNWRNTSITSAPVHLEPAAYFFVLFRIESGQVARIRSYSADCPLDGGGKTVHLFTNVPPADSVAFLKTFITTTQTTRIVDSAVVALSMHKGDAALDTLLALAKDGQSTKVKTTALFWLAQRAGEKAVGAIKNAIDNDPETQVKKQAVFALSQLPRDEGVPLLIQQARNNKNPEVRKQAMFWLGQSKDPRALEFFREILK